jgi:hypothetical protein
MMPPSAMSKAVRRAAKDPATTSVLSGVITMPLT